MTTPRVAIPASSAGDRLARGADGVLRWLGDALVGLGQLLLDRLVRPLGSGR